jgi:hypothetical protein
MRSVSTGSRLVPDPGWLPVPHRRGPDRHAALAARAGAVIADYDQVRTWSDPAARQCELARLGAAAVELLRHLDGGVRADDCL